MDNFFIIFYERCPINLSRGTCRWMAFCIRNLWLGGKPTLTKNVTSIKNVIAISVKNFLECCVYSCYISQSSIFYLFWERGWTKTFFYFYKRWVFLNLQSILCFSICLINIRNLYIINFFHLFYRSIFLMNLKHL